MIRTWRSATIQNSCNMPQMKVTVLQCSDRSIRNFAAERTVQTWAAEAGHKYRFVGLPKTSCPYAEKVQAILNEYNRPTMAAGHHLLYLDSDVSYTGTTWQSFESQISESSSSDGHPCWFSALDTPATINSGVVLLRKSDDATTLVEQWLAWQRSLGSFACGLAADQLSLQISAMRWINASSTSPLRYRGRCEQIALSNAASIRSPDSCVLLEKQHAVNLCYEQVMSQRFNLPFGNRSFRGLCLHAPRAPGEGVTLQRHGLGPCEATDLFCHRPKGRCPCCTDKRANGTRGARAH